MTKIQDSVILKETNDKKQIEKYFKQNGEKLEYATLLFRASRDGYTAADFHRLCNNKGATLLIIKTNCGKTIGGYTA